MCGRFTVAVPGGELVEEFDLRQIGFDWQPRYNVAPTDEVPVIGRGSDGELRAALFRWGLVPPFAADPSVGSRMINARSESVATKPAFRDAFRQRRCLVAADGFYEWKQEGGEKQPVRVRLRSGRPFAFAGLWERWRREGREPLYTFTILTTDANEGLRPIHDRMPVILARADRERWLDPEADPDALRDLLRPYPAAELEAYAVSRRVNNVRNDSPDCIEPLVPPGPTS